MALCIYKRDGGGYQMRGSRRRNKTAYGFMLQYNGLKNACLKKGIRMEKVEKSAEQWRAELSPEVYYITREAGD